MKDYSEYLSKHFDYSEKMWVEHGYVHNGYAKIVNQAINDYKIKSVIEVGCGTGKVAKRINISNYLGVDSNEQCIKTAKNENPLFDFLLIDIRNMESQAADLVCCFAFLKHFSLDEWQTIFEKVASLGKYFIFNMQVADVTKDDGIDFHHVWKTREEINQDIINAGLVLISSDSSLNSLEPIFICKRN